MASILQFVSGALAWGDALPCSLTKLILLPCHYAFSLYLFDTPGFQVIEQRLCQVLGYAHILASLGTLVRCLQLIGLQHSLCIKHDNQADEPACRVPKPKVFARCVQEFVKQTSRLVNLPHLAFWETLELNTTMQELVSLVLLTAAVQAMPLLCSLHLVSQACMHLGISHIHFVESQLSMSGARTHSEQWRHRKLGNTSVT